MSYDNILYAVEGPVARVTINRPDKMNALNDATLGELKDAFTKAGEDDAVRALLITGAGEKAFVAGADINELLAEAGSAEGAIRVSTTGQDVFRLLEQLGKPSVAMVNGFALGGGCELALACTLRTASSKARFGLPEASLGIVPGYGGSQRLSRVAGPGVAREWVLTGDMFSADEAHRVGVVNRIFEPDELEEGTAKLLKSIVTKGPIALRFCMDLVLSGWDLDQTAGEALEAEYFGKAALTEDMREGMSAFLEKRRPEFKGR